MKEKEILGMMGQGMSPYALLNTLIAASNSKLTPEERAERREKRRLWEEERTRQAKVIKNICPKCDGKLSRGKKDKKNDYKRSWICNDCGDSHTI